MVNEEELRKNPALASVYLPLDSNKVICLLFKINVPLCVTLMKEASYNFARMLESRVAGWQSQGRTLNDDTLAKFDEKILKLRNG